MSGNVMEAFQQGWKFMDDLERQKNEDAWKDESRGRQRKEWKKDDDADAEREALYNKYFPKPEEPAKPATPQGADVAAKGIPIEAQPPAQTEHAPATPTDGQLVPAGAQGLPYTGIDAAYNKLRNESTAGNRDASDWANGLRPEAGAGRGNVNPPNAVPATEPGFGPKITAWGGKPAPTLAEITAPKAAPVAATAPAPAPIAPSGTPMIANGNSTAGAGRGMVNPAPVDPGYQSTAGAGRGVVNPPTVTAADRSVAPGKVDLNNMSPTETQRLMDLAQKQFGPGLRFAKAGPADTAAAAPAAAPRGAEMAAGLPVDVKTNPTKVDARNDLNHMLNFAIDSAKIDLKRGKADGAGLATLIKTAQTIKNEGMDRAVSLMAQGRFQEAQDLYNSAGGHGDMQIVSSQDGFIKVAGQQIPTKIVTMRAADGSTRTVNTAEFQQQGMKIAEQLDAVLKGRQIEVTAEGHKAQREDTKAYRESLDADRDASRAISERHVKVAEMEAADRKAERAAKEPAGPKLPQAVLVRMQGIEKREALYEAERAKRLGEDPKADVSALNKELAALSIQKDLLAEPHMPAVNRTARPEPTKPGQTAQANGATNAGPAKPDNKPKAEPKPAAPAYVPPADSVAGKAVAQREAAIAERNAGKAAKDEGKKQTQAAFAADAGKLSPKELVSKYDGKQGDLTDSQAAALFKAKNQPAR